MSISEWDAIQLTVQNHHTTAITPEGYEKLLTGQAPKEAYGNSTPHSIDHDDGSSLTVPELVATFETLQDKGIISKQTVGETEDTYVVRTTRKQSPPSLTGYGSALSESRTKRFITERKDEAGRNSAHYLGYVKKLGSLLARKQVETPEPDPFADDNHWNAERLTKLRVNPYSAAQLEQAKQPIETMSTRAQRDAMRQQEAAMLARGMDITGRRIVGTRVQPAPLDRVEGSTIDKQAQAEQNLANIRAQVDPAYVSLFEDAKLEKLSEDIAQEIRSQAKAIREARSIPVVPSDEFKQLTQAVRNKLISDYTNDDAPDEVIVMLKHALREFSRTR
jgi:hypothetical protein